MTDRPTTGRNGGVYLVSAARTPIGKFGGAMAGVPAVELGGVAIRAAVERSGLPAETPVDEVLMGQVHPGRRRPGSRPPGGPPRRAAGDDERDDDQQGLRLGPQGDHARRGRDPGRRRRRGRRRRDGKHERRAVSPAPRPLRLSPGRRDARRLDRARRAVVRRRGVPRRHPRRADRDHQQDQPRGPGRVRAAQSPERDRGDGRRPLRRRARAR